MMVVQLSPVDVNAALGETSPYVLAAATGGLSAQRALRTGCRESMDSARAEGLFELAHAHAFEALAWARMAASHGDDNDAMLLVICLVDVAQHWGFDQEGCIYGNQMLSEAIAILKRYALLGCEDATQGFEILGAALAPRILESANAIMEALNVRV
jgi:hypothetical protein